MKIVNLLLISLLIPFGTSAQDAKAKGILDELSKKTKSYSSMQADFEYQMLNTKDDIDETQEGSLLSKGDQYRLNIAGQIILSDGQTVWTILPDAEEVQVSEVPEEDESEYISPNNILSLWEKGFKYKYDSEGNIGGKAVDVINLYPIEAKEKSFHTIKLYVKKDRSGVERIEIKGKDGTDYIYSINSFKVNQAVTDQKFRFSAEEFPNYDVIDLR
jgi:outer membrane lipoprotein-sorting protein